MPFYYLAVLALVQGITEFLPVSSSGHLILLPKLLGMPDQGLALDVAVHAGTLGGVALFFRGEVAQLVRGAGDLLRRRADTAAARLFLLLAIATVPVVIVGLALRLTGTVHLLRSLTVIGWSTIIFGLVLYWADRRGGVERRFEGWNLRDAVTMGLWQAVALVPGVSRSGATITASRLLGFERQDGARIAMLMSIPTIVASEVLIAADIAANGRGDLAWDSLIAALLACGAAYAALAVMMRLLRRVSFTPYVVYRLLLGTGLLWIAYG